MVKPFPRVAALCVFIFAIAALPASAQSNASTPGALRTYSTIYSIGVEWDVAGDANHNARATVEYRQQGSAAWKSAMNLQRVDFNGSNMLSGSILFLAAGTTYDVRLVLSDPDGGATAQTTTVATRPLPAAPVGRTFHVAPGSGGGNGTAGSPFRGIDAAQAIARPGDTFLLHAGDYGGRIWLLTSGVAGQYIVWKAAGDGEALLDGINIGGSYIWLDGLTVRNQAFATFSIDAPHDVAVTHCGFYNNHYNIYLQQGGSSWYIADNTIVGDMPYWTESLDGEGIELNHTSGHTLAHNSITNVADGISTPAINVDMFGNDIFDTSDDGIEVDEGGTNVRIWGNRIHNAAHNGISFQPQTGSPVYIVRNQLAGFIESPFKFRTTDRLVLVNNTIVSWGSAWWGEGIICCGNAQLYGATSRNNLWVSTMNSRIWNFGYDFPDWRTDLDYDGFAWGVPGYPFVFNGNIYADLAPFVAAIGLEQHGLQITTSCFESLNVPSPPPSPVPPQFITLRAGCAAIDAGAVVPNLNADSYVGAAPDLGAYERGAALPVYGPRNDGSDGSSGGGSSSAVGHPVPGIVEAEDFDDGAFWDSTPQNLGGAYRTTAVDIEATTDAGGGFDVGWIDPGEWLEYTIDVQSDGSYQIAPRVASPGGAQLTVSVDGSAIDNALAVPATGGWQSWTSIATSAISLTAGTHRVRLFTASGGLNINNFAVQPAGSSSSGGGHAVPGVIEAEDFDDFWDATPENLGGAYRSTAVDIEPTADAGGGFDVGWIDAGEWLEYALNVTSAGNYVFAPRVASPWSGTTITVSIDGAIVGTLGVPNTGGWQSWQSVSTGAVALSAGSHRLRLSTSTGGLNINNVSVQAGAAATGHAVPGVIEAEDFDAYWDATPGNAGGEYRSTDVDIEATADAGGGYNVGWMDAGEWLEYSINVQATGTYAMEARVASPWDGATLMVLVDGTTVAVLTIPNTGWWQTWQTVVSNGIFLTAGTHRLRILTPTGGMNINKVAF